MSKGYRRRKMANMLKKRGSLCERCECILHLRDAPRLPNSRVAIQHHILPRFIGGSNRQGNLLLTCKPCEKDYHKEHPEKSFVGVKQGISLGLWEID